MLRAICTQEFRAPSRSAVCQFMFSLWIEQKNPQLTDGIWPTERDTPFLGVSRKRIYNGDDWYNFVDASRMTSGCPSFCFSVCHDWWSSTLPVSICVRLFPWVTLEPTLVSVIWFIANFHFFLWLLFICLIRHLSFRFLAKDFWYFKKLSLQVSNWD